MRLTFHPQLGFIPAWSPDGSRFAYSTWIGNGLDAIHEKASSGAGEEKELYANTSQNEAVRPTDYSRDGRFLLFQTYRGTTPKDVWVLPLDGSKKAVKLVGGDFSAGSPRFSPDGRLVTYVSDESGRQELYARPFDASGLKLGEGKWQISRDGSASPAHWRTDGKEIVFGGLDGSFMSVDVTTTGNALQVGTPKRLFARPTGVIDWEVSTDLKRFLMTVDPSRTGGIPFTVVLNWKALLKR